MHSLSENRKTKAQGAFFSKMINGTDTIAAISTAMNNSGIGIVRISGDDAFNIIKKIFRPAKDKDMACVPGYTIHYGHIVDGDNVIDEVLVMIMRAPHTFTREDTAEINCHGGMFVLNRTLELVCRSGARPAEPGEFTKRAFLNGRIDLSQAEAVIDVINAENNYALKSAVSQLSGSVSEKIRGERTVLLEQIAYIEAALDDPEHIEMEGYADTLLPILEKIRDSVGRLIATSDDGRIIKEGIKTVILGKPNVGKSSLLNALLGTERAIVTDIAGTTRDALEESLRLNDITLNVIDTAGIRETDDIIEKIGVEKAKEYAGEADLAVFVIDASKALDEDDRKIADIIRGKKAIALLNKTDIDRVTLPSDVKEILDCPVIETQVINGTGMDAFAETIRDMFYSGGLNFNDQVYITNVRQKNALIEAEGSLEKAIESVKAGLPEDFFTIDMMDAYASLGSVIGEAIEDDLADEIFAKFCMGK